MVCHISSTCAPTVCIYRQKCTCSYIYFYAKERNNTQGILQLLNNTHTCICLLYIHSYICVYKYALKCHMAYVEIYAATCYCRKHTHIYIYALKSWHVCVKSASKVLSTSILSAKTNSTSLWRPKWK